MSNSENTGEECETAMNAALTRALDFCGNGEKQADAMGRLLGVDGVDETKHLETPGTDPMEQRRWVASRAYSKMQEEGGDPYNAIEDAWGDLAQETPDDTSDGLELGTEDEPEPDDEGEDDEDPSPEDAGAFEIETEDEGESDSDEGMLNADDIPTDA